MTLALSLSLTMLLLAQGVPALPAQSGTVSGTLKLPDGKPATGVRVGAMMPPQSPQELVSAAALVSIAETDETGRYRLENVPPGRYYISAGRLDRPTYYPGTLELALGSTVLVTPGISIPGVDFLVLYDSERAASTFDARNPSVDVPFQINVEGEGKVPVFAGGAFVMLNLNRRADQLSTLISVSLASLRVVTSTTYDLSIDNLPEGYSVKSMTFAGTDLKSSPLRIAASAGTPDVLSVVLSSRPASRPPMPGVRVAGRTNDAERKRSIYISGKPGVYFADGSFEFHNVPPGRHVIASLDSPVTQGAVVIVGREDIDGVELRDTSVLPFNVRAEKSPGNPGSHPAGTVLPLASVRGRVVEETSRELIAEGAVTITGYAQSLSYPIGLDGQFEISRLFPGSYDLEVQVFGHTRTRQTVVVGEEDVRLELTPRKLY